MPSGTAFSWAHIDDIAHAHWLAMEKGKIGESYNISGTTYTFIDALKIAKEITGIRLPMAIPAGMLRIMSAIMYLFDPFLSLPESYTGEGLRVIAGVTYIGNNSKAKRELGYNPRQLKEGLTETLKHEMKLLGM